MQTLILASLLAISLTPEPPNPPLAWLERLVESRLGYELPQTQGVVEVAFEHMPISDLVTRRDEILTEIAEECEKMGESGGRLSAISTDRVGPMVRIRLQFSPK